MPPICASWPLSSQQRTFRQPHLLGSGVSFTQASSARILSMLMRVRVMGTQSDRRFGSTDLRRQIVFW